MFHLRMGGIYSTNIGTEFLAARGPINDLVD